MRPLRKKVTKPAAVLVAALLGILGPGAMSRASDDPAIEASLRAQVAALCDPSLQGRGLGSPGLARAADLLEARLSSLGLEPAFGTYFRQDFAGPGGEALCNLVAILPATEGAPDSEYVVVGAHYDALGMGEDGAVDAGVVHPGADDNASGVAGVLETFRVLRDEYAPLDRPVVCVLFSGEEAGRLGSLDFVAHPPLPLSTVVAMVNLDTVGRLVGDELTVFGVECAAEFASVLQGVNYGTGFTLLPVARGSGASDDTSFREKGIPALQLFSGANADYHRPGDTPDKLDYAGLARIVRFTADLVEYLARGDTRITFVPEGAAEVAARTPANAGRRRVTFGSIPDFQRESGGVLLTGVLPGSPAEKAGLTKGDVIVEFGGSPVDNLLDYSEAMKRFAPGDEVVVKVRRGDKELAVKVTLVERR
jgi:aminopeptidase N